MNPFRFAPLVLSAPALAQTVLFTAEDPSYLHDLNLGAAVASAGDVDGDGFEDLVAGAPSADAGIPGRAVVYSGLGGVHLATYHGVQDGDRFGSSVGSVGDLNGDGRADVIVGAPEYDGFLPAVGLVRVFSGATGNPLRTILGTSSNERLGTRVAGGGLVDGDSVPDLLVASSAGAYVFSGVDSSLVWFQPGWTSIRSAGDVDADGDADVVVGQDGLVRLVDGPTGATLREWTGPAGFGRHVDAGWDMDLDGVPDVLIGKTTFPQHLRLYSGAHGSLLREWTVFFSNSVAFARGDVDGDGTADILAGSFDRVILTRGAGTVELPTPGLDGSTFVASLADVTGDGRPDVGVGGPLTDVFGWPTTTDEGRVLVTTFDGGGPGARACLGDGSSADCPCGPGTIFAEDFSSGVLPPGWSATGGWHVTSACSATDCGSGMNGFFAYMGVDGQCNFVTAAVNVLRSPLIQLPGPGGHLVLSMRHQVQQDGEVHRAFLRLRDAADALLFSIDFSGLNHCHDPLMLDLDPHAGQTVRLEWYFSHDGWNAWQYRGWQVDDVVLRQDPSGDLGQGCRNSTGGGGLLFGQGSTSVSTDDLVLTGAQVPAGNSAVFFVGDTLFSPPFAVGNGLACAGGSSHRYPPVNTGGGSVSLVQPVANSAGLITAGNTYHFQFWFRDVDPDLPCQTGSNLTHAYSVQFTP